MTKKLKSGTPFVYDENDRVVGIRDPHTGTDTDLVTAVTSPGGGVVLIGPDGEKINVGEKPRQTARHTGKSAANFSVLPVYTNGCTAEVVADNPLNALIGGPPAVRKYGGQRLKITSTVLGTIEIQWEITADDLAAMQSDGRVEMWIEIEDREKFHKTNKTFKFELDDTATSTFSAETLLTTGLFMLAPHNGLQVYGGLKSDFTGAAGTWATAKRGRITINQAQIGAVVYLCWAPVALKGGKPMLVLQHDGCWHSQYLYARPRLNQRGLIGTFSAVHQFFNKTPALSTDRCSLEMVKQIEADGHQIIPHTIARTDSFDTIEAAYASYQGAVSDLLADGFNLGRAVTYSGGSAELTVNGPTLADMIREEGWALGACIASRGLNVPASTWASPNVPMPIDPYRFIAPRELIQGSALTATDINNKWDALLARGQAGYSAIPSFHHVVPTATGASDLSTDLYELYLDRAVDAINSGVFENVNMETFFARI